MNQALQLASAPLHTHLPIFSQVPSLFLHPFPSAGPALALGAACCSSKGLGPGATAWALSDGIFSMGQSQCCRCLHCCCLQ